MNAKTKRKAETKAAAALLTAPTVRGRLVAAMFVELRLLDAAIADNKPRVCKRRLKRANALKTAIEVIDAAARSGR